MNNYKYLSKFLLIFFAFTVIIFTTGCETTEPPERKPESVREYTWQIDTLNIPDAYQNLMRSVWASGPNDIYICGHNSGSQINEGNGNMWHYDGNNWEVEDIRSNAGSNGNLSSVHGSSANNVWAVGDHGRYGSDIRDPFIVQFDGARWKKYTVNSEYALYDVFVESRTSVWACGDGGLIYYYDGIGWEVDTIKVPMQENDFFIIYSVLPYDGKMYAAGTNRTSGSINTQFYFFQRENGLWKEIDKFNIPEQNSKFGNRLQVVTSKKLLSYGTGGVYSWENEGWAQLLSTDYSINNVYAQNENNIIAVGSSDTRYHYNGSNWQELDKIEPMDLLYTGTWFNDEEAFIIGFKQIGNKYKTLVLHGK